jgi:iron complex outermembrane receptor protein
MMALPTDEVREIPPFGPPPGGKPLGVHVLPEFLLASEGPADLLSGFFALSGGPPQPDGFTNHDAEAGVMGGSYGHVQSYLQYGKQAKHFAVFVAGSTNTDGGFLQHAPSRLNQFYGDIGWRNEKAELHFNVQAGAGALKGGFAVPDVLVALGEGDQQLSYPDELQNQHLLLTFSGKYKLTPSWTVDAKTYYGSWNEVDFHTLANPPIFGNYPPFTCGSDPNGLCNVDTATFSSYPVYLNGQLAKNVLALQGGPFTSYPGFDQPGNYNSGQMYAYLNSDTVNTHSYGATIDAKNESHVLEMPNKFAVGVNIGAGETYSHAYTELGILNTDRSFGQPLGLVSAGPLIPQNATGDSRFYEIYAADQINPTDNLSIAVASRYNYFQLNRHDVRGNDPSLNGHYVFTHFNPAIGVSYHLNPETLLFGGYTVSNHVPAPSGLFCQDPESSCSTFPSFFLPDTMLKQSVNYNYVAGLTGQVAPFNGTQFAWLVEGYRTDISDADYLVMNFSIGRLLQQNVGNETEQGLKAAGEFTVGPWIFTGDYTFTDATFQSHWSVQSPENRAADIHQNIHIAPGDHIPGIPDHLFHFAANYDVTSKWSVGSVLTVASGVYRAGDEVNTMRMTAPYSIVSLNTNYQLTKHIQIFGIVDNIFNTRYGTQGALLPVRFTPIIGAAGTTNPYGVRYGAPISGYAGIRVKF